MELLNINANVIYTIINLLILVVAFKILLFKKVDEVLEIRKKDADIQKTAAEENTQKAEELKKDLEQKIAAQEAEQEKILADTRERGYAQYNDIVTNARKEADAIIEEARIHAKADAERERAKYMAQLTDVVIDAASKIAATRHTSESDTSLYDSFIDQAINEGMSANK